VSHHAFIPAGDHLPHEPRWRLDDAGV